MHNPPITRNDPQTEYKRRLEARQTALESATRSYNRLANARATVFLAGLGLAVWVLWSEAAPPGWAVTPVVPFLVLVLLHHRCIAIKQRLNRAVVHYRRGLGRMDERWRGSGETGARYASREHLYAEDLDLFGEGSLFELICTARTRMGEDALAAWLLQPAEPPEVLARQEAVRELRGALDLREDLATLPQQVREKLDPAKLRNWIGRRPELHGWVPRCMLIALPSALAVAATVWLCGVVSWRLPALVFLLETLCWGLLHRRVVAVVRIAEEMSQHLGLLSRVLKRLQQETFQCEKLSRLRRRLETVGRAPAAEVARLRRLIDAYDNATRNKFVVPLAIALLLPLRIALAMERWRRTTGRQALDWLAVVGEFEALLALAGYAYERPRDVLPSVSQKGPLIDAVQLGHPLLPEATCRPNDLRLDDTRQMILISGSNMSGKSTMLRTLGINVALALAGAPVRARKLCVSPLSIAATINVRDSLQEGQSHFYVEMARLKKIVEILGGGRGVLFLLDEIMHGTNSHDRRIGTEAVLRKLLDGGAIGMITTHDLTLAEIVDTMDGRAENAHFQDQLLDGKMVFDYRMRPGVVRKSNALDVMRSLGLDV